MTRILEILIAPTVLALIGYWSGWRQARASERAAHLAAKQGTVASQDTRQVAEIGLVIEEWDRQRAWWTAELASARASEEEAHRLVTECRKGYERLLRWAHTMAAKWNAANPTDPVNLPNGHNGNGNGGK